jgi:hypothetical protein
MPLAKRAPVILVPTRNVQKKLAYLYARRCAVDALIQSLEDYDRCQSRAFRQSRRKSA